MSEHVASPAMTSVFSGSDLFKFATVVAPLRPFGSCRSIRRDPPDQFGGIESPHSRHNPNISELGTSPAAVRIPCSRAPAKRAVPSSPATTPRGYGDCGRDADGRQKNAGGYASGEQLPGVE